MTRSTRKLLALTCIALLAAFVVQSNAALVLCVASDHTAVESLHGDRECERSEHALGAPDAGCTDTILSQSSTPAAPERITLAPLAVVERRAIEAPLRGLATSRVADAPPPRELERARSSTVLLI